jgi:hypothetical protein
VDGIKPVLHGVPVAGVEPAEYPACYAKVGGAAST